MIKVPFKDINAAYDAATMAIAIADQAHDEGIDLSATRYDEYVKKVFDIDWQIFIIYRTPVYLVYDLIKLAAKSKIGINKTIEVFKAFNIEVEI